ncbi:unnamed protein product [Trypanosoma congolense IL3000]|uniref:Zinc transporter n=1 Tax=Trypanosoma congolense (strain IL3000) TaxID=1068625 RepID=F9WGL7_TRYCI|nr:conserved hypothetical protein [Trypanosoma congolense IL3000]CCD16454.1 unnamed protein product [Trypanosoma congolense IL3000]
MVSLVALRLLSALVVTFFGVLGVLSPLCCLPRKCESSHRPGSHRTFPLILSLANCFAAGMLITMAVSHFFLHALEEAASGNANPSTISMAVLGGVLFPVVIECAGRGPRHADDCGCDGHSHGALLTAGSQNGRRGTVPLVLLLMFIHAAMEGALLGIWTPTSPLLSVLVPLSVHRVLDGVAIGVTISKRLVSAAFCADELTPLSADTSRKPSDYNSCGVGATGEMCVADDLGAKLKVELCGWPIFLWAGTTPTVALLFALLGDTALSPTDSHGEGYGHFHHSKPDVAHRGGSNAPGTRHSDGFVSVDSFIGATGAGLFLFAGLVTILREEARGPTASLFLLLGAVVTLVLSHMDI